MSGRVVQIVGMSMFAVLLGPRLALCFAPYQVEKFGVINPQGLEEFGTSLAMHSGRAIIGIPGEGYAPGALQDQGSAYVYEPEFDGSLAFAQKLIPPAPSREEHFGQSVSLFGNTALVGAPQHGFGDQILRFGTAYVYERQTSGTWSLKSKFQEGTRNWVEHRMFGNSVSLWETTALVGAPGDRVPGVTTTFARGSAFVFNKDAAGNWSETTRLLASDREPGDEFGSQVALWDDTAIITAPQKDIVGLFTGQSYVFKRNDAGQWIESEKLLPDDAGPDQFFGSSLAMHEDLAVFAARNAAYVFQEDASGDWAQIAKLTVSDPIGGISITDKQILIGQPLTQVNNVSTGSALLFQRTGPTTWVQSAEIFHEDNFYSGAFGYSTALTETQALIGDPGPVDGAAYLFQTALAGDYNMDGVVDAADYVVWRSMLGQQGEWLAADGDGDGFVTEADILIWRSNFGKTASTGNGASGSDSVLGNVPEPTGGLSLLLGLALWSFAPGRRNERIALCGKRNR